MSVEAGPEITIDCANLSLIDQSTVYTVFCPADVLTDTIKAAGYRGFEWHPTRNTIFGFQMSHGFVDDETKAAVRSIHQSYRGEKSFDEAIRAGKLGMASYILLPERSASLKDIDHIQRALGKDVPVVLYPEHGADGPVNGAARYSSTFQPTAEIMNDWGASTVSELADEALNRELGDFYEDVFCVDLAHLRAPAVNGHTLNPWQETLPELLQFTGRIHVSAGRYDMGYDNTEAELKDLLHGTHNTELPEMLRTIQRSGWRGPVVTEIPAASLHRIHGEGKILTPKQLIKDHRAIVSNVMALLS